MIRTLKDVLTIADKSAPKSLWGKGYLIPLLIGDLEKIKRVSDRIG